MIHATIPLSHFTALDDEMMRVLMMPNATKQDEAALWIMCAAAMGCKWVMQYDKPREAAAMVVTMALLKQIEIVEE